MERRDDIKTLLSISQDHYKDILSKYERSLQDQSLDLRVPVKNLMENLRSILDYMAHDIYETYCQPNLKVSGKSSPRNIYFPYGLTENDFRSMVGNSFPDLQTLAPKVYNLIVSIQPFKSGNNWLYHLCLITNEKKHNRLTPQIRMETETYGVKSQYGSVTIPVNNPNVKIISAPGAVKIFGVPAQFTSDGILTAPSDKLKHDRKKWVSFTFEGTNVNVIGLLDSAISNIIKLSKEVYTLIE